MQNFKTGFGNKDTPGRLALVISVWQINVVKRDLKITSYMRQTQMYVSAGKIASE